jgi:hemoglobin-like flavoprotein
MNNAFEQVMDSYHRCEQAGGLFDTFYKLFFAKSPDIPARFARTDMEHQKQIVMASLLWVLRFSRGDEAARREVEQLAESHSRRRHNIPPELYDLWLDALCEAVARHDPQFTPELERHWRAAVLPAIEYMKARY